MRSGTVNRFCGRTMVALSLVALLAVCAGYFSGSFAQPQADEGALAHIFQLSVAAIVPTLVIFLFSADWRRPLRAARELTLAGLSLTIAFVALYFLEHR